MTAMKALSILTNVLLTMWQRAELSGLKNKYTRPRPCWCSGYWFPHRLTSGACVSNPKIGTVVRILAARHKWTDSEILDALAELAFDTPGIPSTECPF